MAARSDSTLRGFYLFLVYLGLVTIGLGIVFGANNDAVFAGLTLILPGVALLIAGKVFMCILLFRAWRSAARYAPRFRVGRRTMDPAAAVAMTLLPLINVVGIFFSLGNLPGELNRIAKAAGLEPRAPGGLGYVTAATFACGVIPVAGLLAVLVGVSVLLPILIVSCSTLADSIENHLAEPASANAPPSIVPR